MTSTTPPRASRSRPPPPKLPLWTSGDTNAFFGLGFNVMVNVLVLTGLCLGVVHIPGSDVFGVILPAMGIQLLIGNVYYTYLARRLARREGRDTVTAMPYGPSRAAHVHRHVRDHAAHLPRHQERVQRVGGRPGLVLHHRLHRADRRVHRPVRSASTRRAPRCSAPWPASRSRSSRCGRPPRCGRRSGSPLPVLVIIMIGFFTDLKLPGNIPVGLAALLVGTAIGWIGGYMHPADVSAAAHDIAISLPTLQLRPPRPRACPRSRRCWPPRSRWASTTSPRA